VDLSSFGASPNSVDVSRKRGGLVAVAMQADVKTDPGQAAFFDTDGEPQGTVPVGSEPDMLTFTRDDTTLLVANEAEPNDAYTVDPVGSVSVIDLRRGVRNARARTATFDGVPFDRPVRIFGPGATPQQDLEPEHSTRTRRPTRRSTTAPTTRGPSQKASPSARSTAAPTRSWAPNA
jgi:hypothetical protein